MVDDIPSIEEQVNALVKGTKFEFVCERLGKDKLEISDYDKIFTVSRSELLDYIPKNYAIEEIIHTKSSKKDGFYALKGIFGWTTFNQERGIRFNEEVVRTKDKVWEKYVSVKLGYSE